MTASRVNKYALTEVERHHAHHLAKNALPMNADYLDFADDIVSLTAANRVMLMALLCTVLTTFQNERAMAFADEMVEAMPITTDRDAQLKLQKLIAGHIAGFRRAAA